MRTTRLVHAPLYRSSDLTEQRFTIDHSPLADHDFQAARVANVLQRVRAEDEEIGTLPRFDRAELIVFTDHLGGASRRSRDRFHRSEPGPHQQFQLSMDAVARKCVGIAGIRSDSDGNASLVEHSEVGELVVERSAALPTLPAAFEVGGVREGHYFPVRHRETQKRVVEVPGLSEEDKSGDHREPCRGHVLPVDAGGKRIDSALASEPPTWRMVVTP